jgi:predicted Zn-dependent protease
MSSDIISQAGRQSYGSLGYFYINSRVYCFKSALLTLMLLFSGNSLGNSLPAISPGASAGMSVADEYRLGRIIAGSIHRQLPLWQDLPTLSLLTDIAQPLISSSQLSNKNLQLFIVHDDRINAFAAPGGIIGINTGLINQAGSVDELAAVIAHEVAHLSLRHYVQTQAQEKVQAPLFVGALLASIWLASNVDGDLGEASMHATQSALQRSQLSYSRAHERQADRVGFELMLQSPLTLPICNHCCNVCSHPMQQTLLSGNGRAATQSTAKGWPTSVNVPCLLVRAVPTMVSI